MEEQLLAAIQQKEHDKLLGWTVLALANNVQIDNHHQFAEQASNGNSFSMKQTDCYVNIKLTLLCTYTVCFPGIRDIVVSRKLQENNKLGLLS